MLLFLFAQLLLLVTFNRTFIFQMNFPNKNHTTTFSQLTEVCIVSLNCDCNCGGHIFIFICISTVHIISLCASFLSQVDERNKLACSPCMGAEAMGLNPIKAQNEKKKKRKKTPQSCTLFLQTVPATN